MAVMGEEDRQPTKQELTSMKDLLRAAMENGALGLSSGLIYHPAAFAKKRKLLNCVKLLQSITAFIRRTYAMKQIICWMRWMKRSISRDKRGRSLTFPISNCWDEKLGHVRDCTGKDQHGSAGRHSNHNGSLPLRGNCHIS